MLPTLASAVVAAVPAACPVPDTGLRPEWVDPRARMVLHFDFALLQRTALWRRGLAEDVHIGWDDMEEIEQDYGIRPERDLLALTVYSMDGDGEHGVAILLTTDAVDTALERLRSRGHVAREEHEGLALEVVRIEDDEPGVAYVHPLEGGLRAVVLSDSPSRTVAAARIVRGEVPGPANGPDEPLQLAPDPGSFLFLAAVEMPGLEEGETASRFFGLVTGLVLDVGEAEGALHAFATVTTDDPEAALQASKIVEGLKALAYFTFGEQDGWTALLDAVRIDTRGSQILFSFEFDVEEFVRILGELDED